MRILLLTHYWAPEIGAPQNRWRWLARGLVERGHELAVLTPAPHYPAGVLLDSSPRLASGAIARDETGAMIHRTTFRPYGAGISGRGADQMLAAADGARLALARFGGGHRPDVVIGSVPGLPTLPVALAVGGALRRPVVAELRDAWPDILDSSRHWAEPPAGLLRRAAPGLPRGIGAAAPRLSRRGAVALLPPLVTLLERRADAVAVTTDSFAQALRERGMRRVKVIRNSAVPSDWGLPAPPVRRDGDDGRPELRVVYLGTVGRSQGLAAAVEAAALAERRGVRLRLRIVGDGAQAAHIRATAERLGAPVEMLPPVAPTAVGAHYAWADTILVSLQDWPAMSMTVPSKLYEALATGRHISGAVDGEAAGIIRSARAGLVVPPQDPRALAAAWAALAADRSGLTASAGRQWLSRHANRHDQVNRYEALLDEVAHG
ncbi:glycosyltransferase family 4 protein [Actinomyces gaoshouyii]|uniref:Glycosyltransferase WbuB n=1 Tax=Actinomyces gaoshouyii TaxID=1960083 RepID=A0A8H9HB27_9ACTO|nr:glycosyltransferase family 4 protein [Actinomyces gaoshouyii]GGO99427.1 glycosyltransferase WbuB [Actinomyces gaoshouyii]